MEGKLGMTNHLVTGSECAAAWLFHPVCTHTEIQANQGDMGGE